MLTSKRYDLVLHIILTCIAREYADAVILKISHDGICFVTDKMLLEQAHLSLVELHLVAFESVHQSAFLLREVVMNGAAVAFESHMPQSVHPLVASYASFWQLQGQTTLLDIRIGQQSAVGLVNLLVEVEQ